MSTLEKKIEEYFKLADSDNSGFLSTFELSKVFEKAGHPQTPEQIVQLFSEVDTNRDGQWTLQELKIALSKRSSTEVTEADLRAMFSDIDKDKSGLISVDELKQLLVKCNKAGDAAKYIKCVDTNEDGKINFEEFLKMWKEGQN